VRRIASIADFDRWIQDLIEWHLHAADAAFQCLTFQQLHGDEWRPSCLPISWITQMFG